MNAEASPAPPVRPSRLRVRLRRLLRVPFVFLEEFKWKKHDNSWRAAWSLLWRWWALGAAARLALMLLAALILAGAFAMAKAASPLNTFDTQSALGAVTLGLFVLAWAAGTGAAMALPAWGFVIAMAWLVYYQILVTNVWMKTPVAIIPVIWLGWLSWRKWANSKSIYTFMAGWFVTSIGLAIVTAGPSGLRAAIGLSASFTWFGLGSIITLMGWAAMVLTRSRPRSEPSFSLGFLGSLLILGTVAILSARRDFATTIDWSTSALDDLAGTGLLFWLWAGGGFAGGAIRIVDWGVRRGINVLSVKTLAWLCPLVIALVTLGEWLWFAPSGRDFLIEWKPEWLRPALKADIITTQVFSWHWWIGLAFLTLWLLPPPRKSFAVRSVARLFMWWIVLGLALQGIVSAAYGLVETKGEPSPLWWQGALIVLFIGLIRQIGQMHRDEESPNPIRLHAELGWTIVVLAMAVALSGHPTLDWNTRQAMNTLQGMIHLGLPMAFFSQQNRGIARNARLSLPAQLGFFAAGNVVAWCAVVGNHLDWRWLLPGLPVLVLLLRWLHSHSPRLHPTSGAYAGTLFGAGVIYGWMVPGPPSIPFLPVWQWFAPQGGWEALYRQFWTAEHVILLASAWLIGGWLGWLAFRKQPSPIASVTPAPVPDSPRLPDPITFPTQLVGTQVIPAIPLSSEPIPPIPPIPGEKE